MNVSSLDVPPATLSVAFDTNPIVIPPDVYEAETPEEAENKVENELSKFMGKNKKLSDTLGARAIQGKAYIPGPDDGNDDIIDHEE